MPPLSDASSPASLNRLAQLLSQDALATLRQLAASPAYHDATGDDRFDLDASAAETIEPLYSARGVRERLERVVGEEACRTLTDDDCRKIGHDVIGIVFREQSTPFKEVLHLVRNLNRSEKEAAARGLKEGNKMLSKVFVHLIKGEDRHAAAAYKKRRVWTVGDGISRSLDPREIGKNDLVIYPVLRRVENAPATSLVLDLDFVVGSDRLQWLIERRSPEQPLSQDELRRLDLRRLTGTAEIEAVLAIRGDLGQTSASARESKAAIKQVDRHLAACRRINRGKDRAAEGSSAGGGYRRDQRGGINLYSNLTATLPSFCALHAFQSGERRLVDHLLGIGKALVPGFTATMQHESDKHSFPVTNHAGTAGTMNYMRGWDAPLHVEAKGDPALTGTISYGNPAGSTRSAIAADFSLAAVNDGRGIVIESGPGTTIWFAGARNLHGTARRLDSNAHLDLHLASTPRDNLESTTAAVGDVTDLLQLGVLTLVQDDLHDDGGSIDSNSAAASTTRATLSLPQERLDQLANLRSSTAPPPSIPGSLPSRALAESDQYRGICFYQKRSMLNFQATKRFDLEVEVMKKHGSLTSRWRSLANPSPGSSTATVHPTASSPSPTPSTTSPTATVPARSAPTTRSRQGDAPSLGSLVGESGDLGMGGTSTGATIAVPVARTTRMTRLAMSKLPEADRRSVQQELDAAWRENTHSAGKVKTVKTSEPSMKRQKT